MKRINLLRVFGVFSLLMLFSASFRANAQSVVVEAKLDSLEMLIGSQSRLTVEATFDTGSKVVFPQLKDTVVRNLEIVETFKPDTSWLNEGKRMTVSHSYMVSAYDSAFFYIPGFEVLVDDKAYTSKSLALKVYLMPIDSVDIRGIKDVMAPRFVLSDWLITGCGTLLIVILVVVAVYLYKRLKDNKPIIRKIHVEPKKLPHEEAEDIIEQIKERKLSHSEDAKLYYTRLTDALRVYFSGRFGFNAMEMTSAEIVEKLLESNDKEAIAKIKSLFTVSDLVKFAKYKPMLNENDANLLSAVEFINKTKIDVPENEREKPHDIIIEEPRSKKAKRILVGSIIAIIVVIAVVMFLVGRDINMMLF